MPPTLFELEGWAWKGARSSVVRHEREITATLKEALAEIRDIMGRIYLRYATDGVLTKAEMTRYNRMANLEAQVLAALDPALAKTAMTLRRIPADAYQESFFLHAYAIDASQGVRLRWGTLNMDAVRADLDNAMDRLSIERYGPDARIIVRQALARGLPLGKTMPAMAKDIKTALETTAYRALRIARTEGMTAVNAGQDAAYARAAENGVEGVYKWDATLDARTRQTHGQMDQAIRDEETGMFDGPGGERARFPGDENLSAAERINCRCRLRYEVAGYSPLLRRTREKGLVGYQTYTEYAKEHHPEWLRRRR